MSFLPDANIWLALTIEVHVFHKAALAWYNDVMLDSPIHFNRSTQQSFLRLLSTAAIWSPYQLPPLTNARAWTIYHKYLEMPSISFIEETHDLEIHWKRFASRSAASPKLWMDAYLAAFAVSEGLTLVTTDKALKQFKGCNIELIG